MAANPTAVLFVHHFNLSGRFLETTIRHPAPSGALVQDSMLSILNQLFHRARVLVVNIRQDD